MALPPQTGMLVELVRDGAIGELRVIRAAFGFNLPWMDNVRWDPALEGGALMDVGCYCVSAARLIAGAETRARLWRAGAGRRRCGRPLRRRAALPGDVLATIDCGMDVHRRNEIEVVGSEGTLLVPSPWQTPLGALIIQTPAEGDPIEHRPESVDPYTRELEEFGDAVTGGPPPRIGRSDALGQARTIKRCTAPPKSGAAVPL